MTIPCRRCHTPFEPRHHREAFCSYTCRLRPTSSTVSRYRVLERDAFRCVYCGASSIEDGVRLHVDHVVPSSRGGTDDVSNLATACEECNESKSARLLPPAVEARVLAVVATRNVLSEVARG